MNRREFLTQTLATALLCAAPAAFAAQNLPLTAALELCGNPTERTSVISAAFRTDGWVDLAQTNLDKAARLIAQRETMKTFNASGTFEGAAEILSAHIDVETEFYGELLDQGLPVRRESGTVVHVMTALSGNAVAIISADGHFSVSCQIVASDNDPISLVPQNIKLFEVVSNEFQTFRSGELPKSSARVSEIYLQEFSDGTRDALGLSAGERPFQLAIMSQN